ncbi:MAG: RNA-binding protein [Gammaproteobacteria bacterium]
MKKLYVGNLPQDATEESISTLFSQYGTVRSIRLASDVFSGKCRGFGFIEMEGHEARAAVSALDGKEFGARPLRVRFEKPKAVGRGRGRGHR